MYLHKVQIKTTHAYIQNCVCVRHFISKMSKTDILFFLSFTEKIKLDISCEWSAGQMLHMKFQALLYVKKKRM